LRRSRWRELYRQHDEICKRLTRVRRVLRDEAKKKGREEYYDSMPKIEVDKHINRLLDGQDQDLWDAEGAGGDWNSAIPQHVFPERAWTVERSVGRSPRRWRMTWRGLSMPQWT